MAPLYCAMARRPAPTEYAAWFDRYIRLVEDLDDVAGTMARQIDETTAFYRGLSAAQAESRYAPHKWTIKEVRSLGARGQMIVESEFVGLDGKKTASAVTYTRRQ